MRLSFCSSVLVCSMLCVHVRFSEVYCGAGVAVHGGIPLPARGEPIGPATTGPYQLGAVVDQKTPLDQMHRLEPGPPVQMQTMMHSPAPSAASEAHEVALTADVCLGYPGRAPLGVPPDQTSSTPVPHLRCQRNIYSDKCPCLDVVWYLWCHPSYAPC